MEDSRVFNSTLDAYFFQFWEELEIDINKQYLKVPINRFNACCNYIYNHYVKPQLATYDNIYNIYRIEDNNLINLIEWYIDKMFIYNFTSIYGFNLLVGYSKDYLNSMMAGENAGPSAVYALKKLYECYQENAVSRLNEDRIGLITQANNNKDIGLLYSRQNIMETAAARKLVSIEDLPKLSEID